MQQDGARGGSDRARGLPTEDGERREAVVHETALRGVELGGVVGAAVGAALDGAGRLGRDTAAAAARGVGAARETGLAATPALAGALDDARTSVVRAQEILDGVVEGVRERGPAAVAVLAGRRPPRRWPWAVAAALAGAAAGAGAALLVQRLLGQDAPGAQEPEQLVAVVDAGPPAGADARPPAVLEGP